MSFFSFLTKSIAYGIVAAAILLFLLPELRSGNDATYDIFADSGVRPQPVSYASAVNKAAPAVVNIYSATIETSTVYGYRQVQSVGLELGAGVIMDERGYVLTADHVIENASQIYVVLQNGDEYVATIVGRDKMTDLALLQIDAQNLPVIPQNDALETFVGDVVLAIGNPQNLGQTITQGIVSAVGRNGLSTNSYRNFVQTDAAINKGNSGGALINSNGDLVGISSASYTEIARNNKIQGIFFAIPYKLAKKVMKQLIENGRVIRGYLGIVAKSRTTYEGGFIITEVPPRTPAYEAGLQVNDFVYQIDDIAVNSIPQALDIVAETRPGSIRQFYVKRDGQNIVVPVTIGEVN